MFALARAGLAEATCSCTGPTVRLLGPATLSVGISWRAAQFGLSYVGMGMGFGLSFLPLEGLLLGGEGGLE